MSRQRPLQQKGMALVLVLWLLSALMIFVAGIGIVVKREADLAGTSQKILTARAVGEAAINEYLFQLKQNNSDIGEFIKISRVYNGYQVDMEIQPFSGLININSASANLWELLFSYAADIPKQEAKLLAESIVTKRENLLGNGVVGPWESTEDLLTISGFDYNIYYALKDYLVVGGSAVSNINKSAAAEPLKSWLSEPMWSSFATDGVTDKKLKFKVKIYLFADEQAAILEQLVVVNNSSESLPWVVVGRKIYLQPVDLLDGK